VLINGFMDLVAVFKDLKDPERPKVGFFVHDWERVLKKQMKSIQVGFLSDPIDRSMYVAKGPMPSSGFMLYHCLRSTSALEGYHMYVPPTPFIFPAFVVYEMHHPPSRLLRSSRSPLFLPPSLSTTTTTTSTITITTTTTATTVNDRLPSDADECD
jgi:hypothetical protein